MTNPTTVASLHQLGSNQVVKKIVAVFAHPDDETLQIGGILSLASQQGISTHALCLTKGEAGVGHPDYDQTLLAEVRAKELAGALKILGVKNYDLADFPDGHLRQQTIYPYLEHLLQRLEPDVIITHDPSGMSGHPDHQIVSQTVTKIARRLTFQPSLYYSVCGAVERKLTKIIAGKQAILKQMPLPTHEVSIKSALTQKVKACLAHKSQMINTWRNIDLLTWYTVIGSEFLYKVPIEKPKRVTKK
jgi:LmbE family N-acetylglucosaminyl deacetylase